MGDRWKEKDTGFIMDSVGLETRFAPIATMELPNNSLRLLPSAKS